MGKYPEIEEKMEKRINGYAGELKTIRAGRANASVLDKVAIDYYGTMTPVQQVGSISSPEPRLLVIQPWDASVLKEIEKAINASDIGIAPQNDGKVIRLNFPPLTEERRKELVKTVKKYTEEAKVQIRNARRDAIDKYKAMKKDGEITEDDLKETEKDIQDLTDKYIKMLQVKTASRETPIKSLSGGNQQKVILGRWLMTEPDFLILDEPTRGIDVGTKTEIQKLVVKLANEGMSVVFISSEVEEMLRTVTHMGILRDGEKVGELEESELSQENVMKAIAGGDK